MTCNLEGPYVIHYYNVVSIPTLKKKKCISCNRYLVIRFLYSQVYLLFPANESLKLLGEQIQIRRGLKTFIFPLSHRFSVQRKNVMKYTGIKCTGRSTQSELLYCAAGTTCFNNDSNF